MVIICGHTRWRAAKSLNFKEVPIHVALDLTPQQIKAYRIADNKTAELAEWNVDLLKIELNELKEDNYDISALGFDENEIELILNEMDDVQKEGLTEPDAIPETPERPASKTGEVYQLGNHFVMCGDSTDEKHVAFLMNGETADLLLTDPPYNANYEGRVAGEKQKIKNDNMSDSAVRAFLKNAFSRAFSYMRDGANFYIFFSSSESCNFYGAIIDNGQNVRQQLIWNKNPATLSRSDYHYKHEPILYGWKDGAEHYWGGDFKQTTVKELEGSPLVKISDTLYQLKVGKQIFTIDANAVCQEQPADVIDCNKPLKNKIHPNCKPVELLLYLMKNSSMRENVVLDLFGGSGSTLIAAEQIGRKARLMELDTKYCDVIRKRWAEFMFGEKCDWKTQTPCVRTLKCQQK